MEVAFTPPPFATALPWGQAATVQDATAAGHEVVVTASQHSAVAGKGHHSSLLTVIFKFLVACNAAVSAWR